LAKKKFKFHAWVKKCHFGNFSDGMGWDGLGLYRTSGPVRKSGKLTKSGLSGNRTFSFPDAGLLTLLKIEKK
jgi:hypothetical protein